MTLFLPINPENPDPQALQEAACALRQGGIVAYATETLYGLGVDPFQKEALENLYRLKGRPGRWPVSILVKDRDMLCELVREIPSTAKRIMDALLPGPLTVVLPARSHLPERITGGMGKVGVRISPHPLLEHLFAHHTAPITSTSANPTGMPGARDAQGVRVYFPEGVDVILDTGPAPGGTGSTLLDLTTDPPVILREGAIPESRIKELLS